MTLLSIEGLVRSRRSIRYFSDEPLSPDIVVSLLTDALWAPSPHNSQPWRFTVLSSRAVRSTLATEMAGRLAEQLRTDRRPDVEIETQTGRSRQRIVEAPIAILCSTTTEGLVRYEDRQRAFLEEQMAVQSVGAVLQTLFLLAEARGIGSCWMAAPMYCPDVVRRVLNLPDDHSPQALVLMGYAGREGKVRPRRSAHDVVSVR